MDQSGSGTGPVGNQWIPPGHTREDVLFHSVVVPLVDQAWRAASEYLPTEDSIKQLWTSPGCSDKALEQAQEKLARRQGALAQRARSLLQRARQIPHGPPSNQQS